MTTAELTKAVNGAKDYIIRFVPRQRVEHIILMVVFIALSVTGLAQRYYTAGWAEWIIINVGGIEFLRLLHRAFALVFIIQFVYHIVFVSVQYFVKHQKLTMVPTLKDFKDVIDELRYSFGFREKPPQFGRYDYRQKFEYWGLMFGSTVLIVTGFILAFPVAFTKILPGQFVAAAVEFHGFEATLAVLTIVIWHLYDVILRPGVFPADTAIFTGKISKKRVAEEHSLEFPELTAEMEEAERARPEPASEPDAD